jgi:hypothetical protein
MTRTLRSTSVTPLHRYYGAVRPCQAHRYFDLVELPVVSFSFASLNKFSRFSEEPNS